MAYKMAAASLDGTWIDETFGSCTGFRIYEVEGDEVRFLTVRNVDEEAEFVEDHAGASCGSGCGCKAGCGGKDGCDSNPTMSKKIALIADCRCVVCKKIGFHVTKQLERKAISAFDVNLSLKVALDKIAKYYAFLDKKISLREFSERAEKQLGD